MKFVRQLAMRTGGNTRSYLTEVALDFGRVAILLFPQKAVTARDLVTDADFFFVRHAGKGDRHASQFLFCIGDQIQQGRWTGRNVHFAVLAEEDCCDAEDDNSGKCDPAHHRYWRIASRCRVYRNETRSNALPSTINVK